MGCENSIGAVLHGVAFFWAPRILCLLTIRLQGGRLYRFAAFECRLRICVSCLCLERPLCARRVIQRISAANGDRTVDLHCPPSMMSINTHHTRYDEGQE